MVLAKHLGAIIAAAAAIAGSAVTAYVTADATRDVVRAEGDQSAEREDRDARGAARVLLSEFLITGNEITDWTVTGFWRPFGPNYAIDVRPDDMRLIAARLEPEQWIWVQAALSDVTELKRYVAQRADPTSRFNGYLLSRNAVRIAARDLKSIGRATRALQAVAELEDPPYRVLSVGSAIANLRRLSRLSHLPIAKD